MRVVPSHAALTAAALGQCEAGWVEGLQGSGLTLFATMVTNWTDPAEPDRWRLSIAGAFQAVAGVDLSAELTRNGMFDPLDDAFIAAFEAGC
jgi:hypothetical protein